MSYRNPSSHKHVAGHKKQPVYVEDSESDGSNSDMEERIGAAAPTPDQAQAEVDQAMQEHVKKEMFSKAQSTTLDIDIIASPAELAQTIESNIWKLMPHMNKELKQNMAIKNRDMASGDQLAGNLNRCIPLHLEIIQQKNEFPFAMGIHVTGMMDTTLHRHGQCVWRVPPNTQTMKVNEAAFEPKSKINAYMYSNYKMCTLEDLATDVKLIGKTAKNAGHCNVLVGSLAYETLVDHLSRGVWEDQHEQLNLEHIFEPGRSPSVMITEKMGTELVNLLKEPIEEVANSFINLENFHIQVVRADGVNDFASPKNLIGELVGSDKVSGSKLNTDKLQKRYCFHIKAKLDYILF